MKQGDTNNKEPRFMKITASFRCDKGMSEARIQTAFKTLEKITEGSAYILHDGDIYTADEIAELQEQYNEAIASGQTADELEAVPKAGDKKPNHYHVLMAFKNQTRLSTICNAFHLKPEEGHLICKVYNTKDYINLLAYLTHITPRAQADGKHEYSPEEVKGLIMPQFKGRMAFNDCKTYEDFRNAFIANQLGKSDDYLYRVAYEGMTIREVMLKDRIYYIDNRRKIQDARRTYIALQKPPRTLFNYYVGTYEGDASGQNGGIGKSLACLMLAVSLLTQMYPDENFEEMDEQDLIDKGYLFRAGGSGVEYQSYDGEPVIIWEDMRSFNFIKVFGGAERFFNAFDIHPKGVTTSIKYGEVRIINKVNIINGIEPYQKFIDGLTEEYKSETGKWTEKEDKSQALRRVPLFFSLSPESVTVNMQLNYFFADMDPKSYTFRNSYKTAIEHKRPFRKSNLVANDPILLEVKGIEDRYAKTSEEDPPEGMFAILEPVMTETERKHKEEEELTRKKNEQYKAIIEQYAKTAASNDFFQEFLLPGRECVVSNDEWEGCRKTAYLSGEITSDWFEGMKARTKKELGLEE